MIINFSAISLFPKITPRDADLSETLKNTTPDIENQADFWRKDTQTKAIR